MTYTFRDAERSQAKPLIGLYSESGAGKTYGALLLARGFVGPKGTIGMIETESGRGEAYANPEEYPEIGGYKVTRMRDNFSPENYGQAIAAAEKAGLDALIIDSASHEWEGVGGVLSMAADNEAGGAKGPLIWQQPKIQHQQHFMLKFMQTPIPLVILCMRAKYPMRQVTGRDGRKVWERSDRLHPKQSEDILFEMFVHGWIGQQDHKFHMTRCSSRSLEPVFKDERPLSVETGKQLAEWAAGRGTPTAETQAATNGRAETDDAEALAIAKEKAGLGKAAFTKWWNNGGKPYRAAVRPQMKMLQEIAEAADEPDSDPFGKEPAGSPAAGSSAAPTAGHDAPPRDPDQAAELPLNGEGDAPDPATSEAAYIDWFDREMGECDDKIGRQAFWAQEQPRRALVSAAGQDDLDRIYDKHVQEAER